MSGALKTGAAIPGLAAAPGPIAVARSIDSPTPTARAATRAMAGTSLPIIPPPFPWEGSSKLRMIPEVRHIREVVSHPRIDRRQGGLELRNATLIVQFIG